jgi:hypothetical protein
MVYSLGVGDGRGLATYGIALDLTGAPLLVPAWRGYSLVMLTIGRFLSLPVQAPEYQLQVRRW